MRRTQLCWILLAALTGCVGNRTPLLSPPAKPDADLRTRDANVDRSFDQARPDSRLLTPDTAPYHAPDLARPETATPDLSPDRAVDLLIPDTRPPTPDRALDLPAPDLRMPDTRPPSPDLVPDRPQDLPWPDTRPFSPDRAPDLPDGTPDVAPDLSADRPQDLAADLATDLPELDVGPDSSPDADPYDTMAGCRPGTPYPLVLGIDGRLYRFDPAAMSLTGIADVTCGDASLNSLTASPLGRAYISNTIGQLCSLDLQTFETTLTRLDPNLIGGSGYGMALISDGSALGQGLYIATNNGSNSELMTINLTSYTLGDIGAIVPTVPYTELTAGPNNGLYALYPSRPSSLLHLDPQTANALETVTLPDGLSGSFALVYWEGSFYLFMGDVMDSAINNVYRYRTSDGQNTLAGTLPVQVIGAGVALCR